LSDSRDREDRSSHIKSLKAKIRSHIWNLMEQKDIADFPRPVTGRIPNFKGSSIACEKAFNMREIVEVSTLKIDPDSPLKTARLKALLSGKTVVMPTPRLRRGFLVLDGKLIPSWRAVEASTIRGAFKYGQIVENPYELPSIDAMIVGCVAVSRINGVRIGKGGGYSDLEYGILTEAGKVNVEVPIVAVVHDVQVLEEPLPYAHHDVAVDYIVTPRRIIHVEKRIARPKGVIWDILSGEMKNLTILRFLLR